jgi:hypothetical protein
VAILNTVAAWLMKKRAHQIELFIKYPLEVQLEWFKRLIHHGKATEWGKHYDYRSIKTFEQYAERVPVSTYEDLKPYIDRLRNGEQNILWPEEIKWFAKSSGTTSSKSKYIPVSNSSLEECHFRGGKDMLSLFVTNFPNTEIFDGKGLVMGGSHTITEVPNESYYDGDLSAILIQNMPFWAQFMRTPPMSTALMDEWESKIGIMAKQTMQDNVTSLSGVPSWMLVLLKKVLELSGKQNIREVWPNLEVFFHGGVSFIPYREQFKALIPSPKMHYMETYNASEGFFGIQDQKDSSELLLMLDYGIYYEFLPIDELGEADAKAIPLSQVKLHRNYALIITTNAGLWRYQIGDTVRFTCLNPYRIKITGRTKNFINIAGEELIIDNAEKALLVASEKCKVNITEYTAGPFFYNDSEKSAHEWFVEFTQQPENLDIFAHSLDNALKSLNSDYEAKRYHDMVLRPPIVRPVPIGTFYKWLKMKGKLGGQHKVPRLSNNREMIEELLPLLDNQNEH